MITKNHTYFIWLYRIRNYWLIYHLGSGLFIWIFLALAQPFGIYNNNLSLFGLLMFLLLFAIIWPVISMLIDAFTLVWKNAGSNVTPNLFLWFMKVALMTHAVWGIREFFCSGWCIDLKEYGEIWMACILIFLFTYIPFLLYARYRYYHSMVGELNVSSDTLMIRGSGRERLIVLTSQVLYLQSDDNYVDIFLVSEEPSPKREVMRATLSEIEAQLRPFPQFVRTHRSVIVNTQHILKPDKKGSLSIIHKDKKIDVPVSRSFQGDVDHLFIYHK